MDEEYTAWLKMFTDNIQKNGIAFPSIDLFFTLGGSLRKKAAAAVAMLARVERSDSRQPAFQEIYVFSPKGDISHEDIITGVDESRSRSNIRLEEIDELYACSILDRLAKCPTGSAVVILQGALYVSDDVGPAQIEKNAKFSLSEDMWAPQLHRLVQRIEDVNASVGCYVIVDSGESYPARSELNEPFMSLETLAIIADTERTRKNEILAQNITQWTQMLERGSIGFALQSIEKLPQEFDDDKPHLRIQILHAAGMTGNALDEIEKLDMSKASIAAILKTARIAAEAGGHSKSRALLEAVLPRLLSVSDYETALAITRILSSAPLQQLIEAQYQARYPSQSGQRRRNIQSLISAGLFEEAIVASNISEVSQDIRAALGFCRVHLPPNGVPDYAHAIRSINNQDSWAEIAFSWVVSDALRRHLLVHAFEIVFGDLRPNGIEPLGEHAFITFRELMLAVDSNGNFPVTENKVHAAVHELINYISIRPAQPIWRFEIEDLLSHKISGKSGKALLIQKVYQATGPVILFQETNDKPKIDKKEVAKALDFLFEKLEQEGVVVTGRMTLPPDSFTAGIADEVILTARSAIEEILEEGAFTEAIENDVLKWLSIASMTAPHSMQPNADLELYRRIAGRMATTGNPQQARNLIDSVLVGSKHADPIRLREAWFVCADIYSRLKQNHQGLVAAVCGLCTDVPVILEDALREVDVCTRLLRDSGVPELALVFHKRSEEILRQLKLYESQAIVHEYVGFTIEFMILARGKIDRAALLDLLNRMQSNAREVMARKAPPQPMAILLGQVIVIADREKISVPVDARDLCILLGGRLSGHEANLYKQVATAEATASGLLQLLKTKEQARYARDAAFDSSSVAIGARRLLSGSQLSADDEIFTLELLNDRAISLPGWQTIARPVPQLESTAEPGRWAIEISRRGIDVVVIGLDEEGCAHAILARQGVLWPPKRLDEEFSRQGFLEWARHYPYRYGIDEETPNLFYVSTEGLNFPFEVLRATVIIGATRLQQFPVPLYRLGGQFIGQIKPVFSAPSLSWLYAASSSPASTNKRLTGWISNADQQGQTLVFAKERLVETIEKYEIELDTGQKLPDGFWGAEMSLVVAHGSVLPGGRFFQRVSDEGTLRVTTEDFAKTFRNVGVVVLFVCNAGRIDQSPEGESTYGLARELLGQGCSAVVASPWPLDARVPYHWFPAFMDAWSSGKSVVDATFLANERVSIDFSSSLANCLAMTVFGDGLRMRMR